MGLDMSLTRTRGPSSRRNGAGRGTPSFALEGGAGDHRAQYLARKDRKKVGCRYLVIAFTPGSYPPGEHYLFDGQFNVAVVSSFLADEPLDLVFEAAALLS